jgi:predicted MFS family arabinose efflux permease
MIKLEISKKTHTLLASAQLYLTLSILFGTWVIYIPQLVEKLNMSEGQLGIVLFFGAVGALVGTQIGKLATRKFGEGPLSFYSVVALAVFTIALFVAPSFYYLSVAMFLNGFSGGLFQVSVNSMVAYIERNQKISIMSTCHGFFSLGAIISSGLGTLVLIALKNPLIHVLLASALVLILQIIFIKKYYPIKDPKLQLNEPFIEKNTKNSTLIWLALIAITVMVSEGAIADWSGLFLQDVALAKKELLGLGYAGFSLSMTIGRFTGDYFSKKFGALKIIIAGFTIGLAGFTIVLMAHPLLSIAGFFVVGAGFSIIVPEIYRLSANLKGVEPASGIAFMAGAGYVGFLAGPVALGFIAETFGLSVSFIVLFCMVTVGSVLSIGLRLSSKLKLAGTQ